MIVIGERINTSRKLVNEAVSKLDSEFICNEAKSQVDAGACYIDVNAGTFVDKEKELMEWIIKTIQKSVSVPLCIDSPNPLVLEHQLKICEKKPIINSISGEKNRLDSMLPLIKEFKPGVIGLCLDDTGMPKTTEQRVSIASMLVERLTTAGINESDIYLDPLVIPVSTDHVQGKNILDTMYILRQKFVNVHLVCGLSNISYGLPNRKLLNQVFLVLAIQAGLDAVILDPMDNKMMSNLIIAQTILGQDEYCMNYLKSCRSGVCV